MPQNIINDVNRILNKRFPDYLNANSSRKHFLKYMECGNHVSIDKNTDKCLEAINKNEKNNYIIPFRKILTCFILDPHLRP